MPSIPSREARVHDRVMGFHRDAGLRPEPALDRARLHAARAEQRHDRLLRLFAPAEPDGRYDRPHGASRHLRRFPAHGGEDAAGIHAGRRGRRHCRHAGDPAHHLALAHQGGCGDGHRAFLVFRHRHRAADDDPAQRRREPERPRQVPVRPGGFHGGQRCAAYGGGMPAAGDRMHAALQGVQASFVRSRLRQGSGIPDGAARFSDAGTRRRGRRRRHPGRRRRARRRPAHHPGRIGPLLDGAARADDLPVGAVRGCQRPAGSLDQLASEPAADRPGQRACGSGDLSFIRRLRQPQGPRCRFADPEGHAAKPGAGNVRKQGKGGGLT
ncbi:hypothetical protein BN871_AY_00160 [Paenibacillus sp. P22]|nr:hypothetical protein BN871_AY_00160 [Paenibacillus sp. P22]